MSPLLAAALAAAEAAGRRILEVYRSGDFQAARKADDSPVTRADREADALLLGLLSATGVPCITEESCPPYETRRAWRRAWLIDPLDGTKDFLARNDEFTVNIALIEDGAPVLGVVHAPALGTTHFAEKGSGAFRRTGGRDERIRNAPSSRRPVLAESRFHGTPEVDAFCARHGIADRRKFGSALKFCRLAEGEADVYPRFTGSREWDTAAGHILLLESGCLIADAETGGPLVYNKPDTLNPPFIARAAHLDLGAPRR